MGFDPFWAPATIDGCWPLNPRNEKEYNNSDAYSLFSS
jgi:hypothetical protein